MFEHIENQTQKTWFLEHEQIKFFTASCHFVFFPNFHPGFTIYNFRKEHVPYCFNALGPYYDTTTAEHVILKTGDNGKVSLYGLVVVRHKNIGKGSLKSMILLCQPSHRICLPHTVVGLHVDKNAVINRLLTFRGYFDL